MYGQVVQTDQGQTSVDPQRCSYRIALTLLVGELVGVWDACTIGPCTIHHDFVRQSMQNNE